MSIRLMTDIPDDLVFRKIQSQVKRHGQFHSPQVGSQMSSGHTDLLNQELPDLLRQFPVVRFIYLFNIICFFDFIQ